MVYLLTVGRYDFYTSSKLRAWQFLNAGDNTGERVTWQRVYPATGLVVSGLDAVQAELLKGANFGKGE